MIDLREPPAHQIGSAWISIDVGDQSALTEVFAGNNVVFHLAPIISVVSSHGGLVKSVNGDRVEATAQAALAVGVPRFVHCAPPGPMMVCDRSGLEVGARRVEQQPDPAQRPGSTHRHVR